MVLKNHIFLILFFGFSFAKAEIVDLSNRQYVGSKNVQQRVDHLIEVYRKAHFENKKSYESFFKRLGINPEELTTKHRLSSCVAYLIPNFDKKSIETLSTESIEALDVISEQILSQGLHDKMTMQESKRRLVQYYLTRMGDEIAAHDKPQEGQYLNLILTPEKLDLVHPERLTVERSEWVQKSKGLVAAVNDFLNHLDIEKEPKLAAALNTKVYINVDDLQIYKRNYSMQAEWTLYKARTAHGTIGDYSTENFGPASVLEAEKYIEAIAPETKLVKEFRADLILKIVEMMAKINATKN